MPENPDQAGANPSGFAGADAAGLAAQDTPETAPPAPRPFLIIATEDAPGCPAGSAVNRVELLEAMDPWPGFAMVEDDGRALWTPPPPAPEVPSSITNFQARAALMAMPSPSGTAGRTLFQDVDDALKAQGGVGWQAWEYANDVTRDGALVNSLGQRLGMAPAQLDQFFIAASGISA